MCSYTNQKFGSMQFLYDSDNIAKDISVHNLICLVLKVQKSNVGRFYMVGRCFEKLLKNQYPLCIFLEQVETIGLWKHEKRNTILIGLFLNYFFKSIGVIHPSVHRMSAKSSFLVINIICMCMHTLHSQILATWNFSNIHDIVPWIGEELHIEANF